MTEPNWQKVGLSVVLGYEVAALWSPLPTITKLARSNPLFAVAVVGVLALHFHPKGII